MSSVTRLSAPWLLAVLLSCGVFTATSPVEASHFRGGKVEWCWDPPGDEYSYNHVSFYVTAIYERWGNQQLGDTLTEIFNYGDGTYGTFELTVTSLQGGGPGDPGWLIAVGTIPNHFYSATGFVRAGIDSCCRITGVNGDDLNNRSDGYYAVRSQVYVGEEYCSEPTGLPTLYWLSSGLGETVEIQLPVAAGPKDSFGFETVSCRFASDAEAGGGPNPDGMTIDPATCRITWTPTTGDPNKLWTTQVQAELAVSYGEFVVASTPMDFLLGLDSVRPVCVMESTTAGPPTRINVRIQDLRSGLASVQVLESANATVNTPAITPGWTGPLTVVGTKIDQSKAARIRLRIFDQAGNSTDCDPVLTQVVRETGKPESQTFTGIPPEERAVTVLNGNPGLRTLDVEVNGWRFHLTGLGDGEERTLDVGAAVQEGQDSTFVLTTHGKPGSSATVMIWDGLR